MTNRETIRKAGNRVYPNGASGPEWASFAKGYEASLVDQAEAAEQSVPLDWEAMRKQKGWPTPDSMRNAADGLDQIAIPKYGDILRWVADACDARLVDGAQATPQPAEWVADRLREQPMTDPEIARWIAQFEREPARPAAHPAGSADTALCWCGDYHRQPDGSQP